MDRQLSRPCSAVLTNQHKRPKILALTKPVGDTANTLQRQTVFMRQRTQIIVARLRPAGPVKQMQVRHIPHPSAESRTACGMRLCLPARMGGGGKPEPMPWRGPAGEPATRGCLFRFGNERAKPLGVPSIRKAAPSGPAHSNGARARCDADGRCVGKPSARQGRCIADAAPLTQSSARPALARQEERRERLRVSTKTPRPQERRMRGTERVLRTLPLNLNCSRS